MVNKIRSRLYDLLDELTTLNQEDLENRFSKENVKALRRLAADILGDESCLSLSLPSEFVKSVYKLREAKRTWWRRLGDTIIIASESYDEGDMKAAIKIFDTFIKDCPSPFLKKIAMAHKKDYEAGKIKKISEEEKMWGRKAGNVLADAWESLDKGDKEKAITILEKFIKSCPIEAYKKDAQTLKDEIVSKQ